MQEETPQESVLGIPLPHRSGRIVEIRVDVEPYGPTINMQLHNQRSMTMMVYKNQHLHSVPLIMHIHRECLVIVRGLFVNLFGIHS